MSKTPPTDDLERDPYGAGVAGPPWILGHRGVPRDAPENTLVSLRRAMELGLDGFEYDLQACATGEGVLLHDETLDRTTDHVGAIAELTLPELTGVDAGGWFHKRFRGEPLALLGEALELEGERPAAPPLHMIEVKASYLVPEVARRVAEFEDRLGVRLASFDRAACVEARSLGLAAMLLAVEASEEDRRFVRDEGLAAYSVGPGGWGPEVFAREWDCERWSWSLDDPDELLWAARAPLFGWNTNEPHRALAARALASLAPADAGPWPVGPMPLEVASVSGEAEAHGSWSGRWGPVARLRNPMRHPVDVDVDLLVRGGAFEVEGLPCRATLEAGGEFELPFALAGGSWSPGEDPRLIVRFSWGNGPGRRAGDLVLDTTLERRRTATLQRDTQRLAMLVEGPGRVGGSMVIRRRGSELSARVEDPAGLDGVRALVRLGSAVRRGAMGVRVALPPDFDERDGGVAFSAGFEGLDEAGEVVLRRWCGGIPGGTAHGAPGRLFPGRRG